MSAPDMGRFTAHNTGTGMYTAAELANNMSNKFYRLGFYDMSNTWCPTREYFFISKPDLHLVDDAGNLNPEIDTPYFRDLLNKYPDIICELQKSYKGEFSTANPFITLLTNKARSNMDLPSFEIETMDNGSTAYNDNIIYMQSSLIQDDHHEFTIEFEEDIFTRVFKICQCWDEYERLKMQGLVTPPNRDYTINRVLHDQVVAYKIVVDQDGETILFSAMAQGVFPLKVPADTFSDCSNGVTNLSIPFHGNWVKVNKPEVLLNFKNTIKRYNYGEKIDMFDTENWHMNMEAARCPDIEFGNGYHSFDKLIWRR